MRKWNYEAKEKIDSGYEDIWEELEKFTKVQYDSLEEKEKLILIDKVFNIYRERNIFPMTYYTKEGIFEELLKCRFKEYKPFNGEILDQRPTQGTALLKFLFPNIQDVVCKNLQDNSVWNRFYDDHKLKRAIKFCFEFKPKVKSPLVPTELKTSLEMIGGNIPTNFLPMKVKILVDYFMKEGETFLDFSCGFGGRLLGVLSSQKNLKYIGFEPNLETYTNLLELKGYIEEAYNLNSSQSSIFLQGSEIPFDKFLENSIDFSFSSPPYFDLERYSDEDTQCYNKYPNLEDWLEGYVRATVKNLYFSLKKGKYCAVNISDFKINNNNVEFVKEWIKISEEEGFKLVQIIPMKLGRERPNNLSEKNAFVSKEENIYLFTKE